LADGLSVFWAKQPFGLALDELSLGKVTWTYFPDKEAEAEKPSFPELT
jgi:hypothetical protein